MRSPLSVIGAAFGVVFRRKTVVPDEAGTVRLAMPGWTEAATGAGARLWRDADGDILGFTVLDPAAAPLGSLTELDLQRAARQVAEDDGAGLIEVATAAPPPRSIVSLIYKRLQAPAYVYTGILEMVTPRLTAVWKLVADERGMTGVREALITIEMFKAGELTPASYLQSWAQDPYDPAYHGVDRSVLRFLSDDERYDARFPTHPLSKVRRVLAALPASVEWVQ